MLRTERPRICPECGHVLKAAHDVYLSFDPCDPKDYGEDEVRVGSWLCPNNHRVIVVTDTTN